MVQEYNAELHFPIITKWLTMHNTYLPTQDEMPAIGFVYPDVAAGFLRMVEGGFAQLDGLVSNPEQPSHIRHEGIDIVVCALLNKAKSLKIKNVTAYSIDKGTLLRAKGHGFVHLPHTVIAVEFKE